jgi:hypothetical protein
MPLMRNVVFEMSRSLDLCLLKTKYDRYLIHKEIYLSILNGLEAALM